MSEIYKITLSPVDWYFFGGETTYGGSEKANYYAKSNLFPQESAVIGMLRYEILKKLNLLKASDKEKEAVIAAIGNSGFNPANSKESCPIGLIDAISPVMIQYKEEVFNRAPLNYGTNIKFKNADMESPEGSKIYLNGLKKKLPIPVSKINDARKIWISCSTGEINEEVTDDKMFTSKSKIGITKQVSNRNDDNKEGYFKGKLYTLKKDYKFVFYAQLGMELDKYSLVYLGAERSMFKMIVSQVEGLDELHHIWNKIPVQENQVVFFSEAFVPVEIYQHCSFAWTDSIQFRCITRPWKSRHNYASLDIKQERSCRYNILHRGSVLYYDTEEQREQLQELINNPYFLQFGYNQSNLKK